jgi:hypothetical protein
MTQHVADLTNNQVNNVTNLTSQKGYPRLGQINHPIMHDRYKMTCPYWWDGFFYACPNGGPSWLNSLVKITYFIVVTWSR